MDSATVTLTKGELKFLMELLNADGISFSGKMKRDLVALEDKILAALGEGESNVVQMRPPTQEV